jgi:LemA protein
MLPLVAVCLAVLAVLAALWMVRTYRDLLFLRAQVQQSWTELQAELVARREIIPYVVASVHVGASQMVELVGNACDLAAHVVDVREAARAEARLTVAVNRIFTLVDGDAELRDNASVLELRRRLAGVEMKIGVLRDIYNAQAKTLNARLEVGVGRVLGQIAAFREAQLFAV